ncbi:MAG: hypothetical protein ACKVOJ_00415 [Sphingomonadaceae bacterium]
MKILVTFMAGILLTSSAMAQQVVMPKPVNTMLRTGTPVVLRLLEGISTKEKTAKINDRVRMEVAEAIVLDGVTVIPSGSPAVGELTDVRYKGMWGKSGRIVGRALTLNANGRTIRLSGTFDSKGGSGTVGAVAVSAIVFAPAGFFMTGKSAELAAGTTVRGFIDEDVPLLISPNAASNAAAPMVVK